MKKVQIWYHINYGHFVEWFLTEADAQHKIDEGESNSDMPDSAMTYEGSDIHIQATENSEELHNS